VQEREQVAGAPGQVQVYQYCSITKMPQYGAKSLEELRFEDYAKGNTGAVVLRVEGAGAYDHVQGEYKVDVAAGPCAAECADKATRVCVEFDGGKGRNNYIASTELNLTRLAGGYRMGDRVTTRVVCGKVAVGEAGTVIGPCSSQVDDKATRVCVEFDGGKGRLNYIASTELRLTRLAGGYRRGDRVTAGLNMYPVAVGDAGTVIGPCTAECADQANRVCVEFDGGKGRINCPASILMEPLPPRLSQALTDNHVMLNQLDLGVIDWMVASYKKCESDQERDFVLKIILQTLVHGWPQSSKQADCGRYKYWNRLALVPRSRQALQAALREYSVNYKRELQTRVSDYTEFLHSADNQFYQQVEAWAREDAILREAKEKQRQALEEKKQAEIKEREERRKAVEARQAKGNVSSRLEDANPGKKKPWSVDELGSELFRLAFEGGDTRQLEPLLNKVSNLSLKKRTKVREWVDDSGATPLYAAAYNGNVDALKLLLRAQFAPDMFHTKDGVTPLYAACDRGHLATVKELVKGRADPMLSMRDTAFTPLTIAETIAETKGTKSVHQSIVELLRAHVNSPQVLTAAPTKSSAVPTMKTLTKLFEDEGEEGVKNKKQLEELKLQLEQVGKNKKQLEQLGKNKFEKQRAWGGGGVIEEEGEEGEEGEEAEGRKEGENREDREDREEGEGREEGGFFTSVETRSNGKEGEEQQPEESHFHVEQQSIGEAEREVERVAHRPALSSGLSSGLSSATLDSATVRPAESFDSLITALHSSASSSDVLRAALKQLDCVDEDSLDDARKRRWREALSWGQEHLDHLTMKEATSLYALECELPVDLGPKSCFSAHTILVVDNSASMRQVDVHTGTAEGDISRTEAAKRLLTTHFLKTQIDAGAQAHERVSLIKIQRGSTRPPFALFPLDHSLADRILRAIDEPRGHGDYLPALELLAKLVELTAPFMKESAKTSILFFSDGKPSDHIDERVLPAHLRQALSELHKAVQRSGSYIEQFSLLGFGEADEAMLRMMAEAYPARVAEYRAVSGPEGYKALETAVTTFASSVAVSRLSSVSVTLDKKQRALRRVDRSLGERFYRYEDCKVLLPPERLIHLHDCL